VKKHGPVGLIHVDAHTDTNDEMFGEKIAHGSTSQQAANILYEMLCVLPGVKFNR